MCCIYKRYKNSHQQVQEGEVPGFTGLNELPSEILLNIKN